MEQPSGRWMARGALALARHPRLWGTAVRQLLRLAPPGWWRRAPHLPLPDPGYLRFRLVTAYGGRGGEPEPGDLVSYLAWCRAWPYVTSARAAESGGISARAAESGKHR